MNDQLQYQHMLSHIRSARKHRDLYQLCTLACRAGTPRAVTQYQGHTAGGIAAHPKQSDHHLVNPSITIAE